MNILITGGAGFVGHNLARFIRQDFPDSKIIIFDNLRRRGSELNLDFFRENNIEFIHGDIRLLSDLEEIETPIDIVIEASAEPSVLTAQTGKTQYVLQTNLQGTLNALEFCKKRRAALLFLSTSRVYSIPSLKEIALREEVSRFVVEENACNPLGVSGEGIDENFCVSKYRSFYGATKLASEYFIQEYAEAFDIPCLINRCGVIAGPYQWGKVDQGVFTFWMAKHYFKGKLNYQGFGGMGKQVRDLLHPHDLFQLVKVQMEKIQNYRGEVFNVGGGNSVSTSLRELTQVCQQITNNKIEIGVVEKVADVDVPYYVTNNAKVHKEFDWVPRQNVTTIMHDIFQWLKSEELRIKHLFG